MPSAAAIAEMFPPKNSMASVLRMGADYGDSHMCLPIGFCYRLPTIDCMETVGARIRRLRKARGMTQTDLAADVGVDQSTISDIERGTGFSAEILMKLCDALEATPQEVMRGAVAQSPAVRRAEDAVKKLTDDERREVLKLLVAQPVEDHEVEARIPITKALKRKGKVS